MSSASKLAFGSANCSREIEKAILNCLVNDETHPQASPRFGTHFLAFPLLHVNRYLRQQVAKLLYHIAFETERESIYYPNVTPIKRDLLVFTTSTICYQNGIMEDDDPRYVFTKRGHQMHSAEYHPRELEHNSPELYIVFKQRLIRGEFSLPPSNWSVPTDEKGFEHGEFPLSLQLLSTAWFDTTKVPKVAFRPGPRSGFDETAGLTPDSLKSRLENRFGFKSTVPLPTNANGMPYDIDLAPIFRPTWGTKAEPGPHKCIEEISNGKTAWAISYESCLMDMSGLAGDDEDLKILIAMAEEEERQREMGGEYESTSSLDVKYVKIPLLDALRPPIASKSPYYIDSNFLHHEDALHDDDDEADLSEYF